MFLKDRLIVEERKGIQTYKSTSNDLLPKGYPERQYDTLCQITTFSNKCNNRLILAEQTMQRHSPCNSHLHNVDEVFADKLAKCGPLDAQHVHRVPCRILYSL